MNKKYNITPTPIIKPFRDKLAEEDDPLMTDVNLPDMVLDGLTPMDKKRLVKLLEKEMLVAAKELNFELAANLRDRIKEVTKS